VVFSSGWAVNDTPGMMALTRILCFAHSNASVLVKDRSAALVQA
jgi:hypothetical protein